MKFLKLGLILVGILTFSHSYSLAHADISDWQRGASIQPTSPTSFTGAAFKQSLQNLKNDNANYVNLVIPIYQSNIHSTDIAIGGDTPTDDTIANAIDVAHSLGLKVSLKPHIETRDGQWRANIDPIDPTNRTTWFANYGTFIQHYAAIAEAHHAEQFIIGTELIDLSSDDYNPKNTPSWRSLISTVRGMYHGSLTYAANWGTGQADEKNRITFWDALDYVGIDAYYPLGTDISNNSVEYFRSYWAAIDQNDIQVFAKKVNKPIIFTELGYRSTTGAHLDPGDYRYTEGVNLTEQANAYEALFEYWNDKAVVKGIHMWNWDGNPNAGGSNDTDYTPQNKPAELILKKWYGLSGHISYPTTPANISAPNFFATTTVSSGGTTSTSVQLGNQISASTNVTNYGGDAGSTLLDVEIYNASGNKVFQNFSNNQSYSISNTQSFINTWTPTVAGIYTVKVGVFKNDWSKNFLWQENATQFTVASVSTPVPPTPVVNQAQPSFNVTSALTSTSTYINQSFSTNSSVTNTGTALSNALIDLEIYNGDNQKVAQQVFENQTFAANQTKQFALSYVPSSVGTYGLKVGVFTNDWSKNYIWKDALTIPVTSVPVIPPVVIIPPVVTPPVATTTPTSTIPVVIIPPVATTTPTSTIPVIASTTPAALACPTEIPSNIFSACYYDNKDLTNLKVVRTENTINFDWGGGSPDNSKIDGDSFSALWQGTFNFENAYYKFNTMSDDGIRLYIDNKLVLDKWIDQVAGYEVNQAMTVGQHTIKIEYYDASGGARASVQWNKGDAIALPVVPPIVAPIIPIIPIASTTPTSTTPVVTPPAVATSTPTTTLPIIIPPVATTTPVVVTPVASTTPTTTPPVVIIPAVNYSIDIWWPSNGVNVSGTLPLKALVSQLDVSEYKMYWQVDEGTLVLMGNSYDGYPHKETQIDVSGWNWKGGDNAYTITFVAKDSSGKIISQKSTTITVAQ